MPRGPRILLSGAWYHVTSRGNGRQVIFHHDGDRERFIEQLGDCVASYGVVLKAFVLMENHYHLLVQTPKANLNRFMQRVNTSYGLYYRYKHQRPGHVFQGRYKSLLVTDDEYLLTLARYIHLNPVKTKAWRDAAPGEARRYLRGYRWSSYPSYAVGVAAWPWLDLSLLKHYGRSRRAGAARYRAYTESMIGRDDDALREALSRAAGVLGDRPEVARLVQKGGDKPFDWDAMDERVAREHGLESGDLKGHGGSVGVAKRLALEIARQASGASLQEVGRRYGVSASAVNMNRRRLRPEDLRAVRELTGAGERA